MKSVAMIPVAIAVVVVVFFFFETYCCYNECYLYPFFFLFLLLLLLLAVNVYKCYQCVTIDENKPPQSNTVMNCKWIVWAQIFQYASNRIYMMLLFIHSQSNGKLQQNNYKLITTERTYTYGIVYKYLYACKNRQTD